MSDPRDDDLNRYLAGRSRLSELYRRTRDVEPPAELDATILSAAGVTTHRPRAVKTRPQCWALPVALAATLVLGAGLVGLLQHGISPPRPAAPAAHMQMQGELKQAPESNAPLRLQADSIQDGTSRQTIPVEGPGAEPGLAPAPARKTQQTHKAAASKAETDTLRRASEGAAKAGRNAIQSPAPPPAPESPSARDHHEQPGTSPAPPQKWLERIAELRRRGDTAAADASLREFRRHYPDYPLLPPEPAPPARR